MEARGCPPLCAGWLPMSPDSNDGKPVCPVICPPVTPLPLTSDEPEIYPFFYSWIVIGAGMPCRTLARLCKPRSDSFLLLKIICKTPEVLKLFFEKLFSKPFFCPVRISGRFIAGRSWRLHGVARQHIGQAMQTPLRQFPFIEDYLQDPGSTEKFIHFIVSFCKLN
jgi:hypothetical protein